MESAQYNSAGLFPEYKIREANSAMQLLHVDGVPVDRSEDYLQEGIYVCHTSLLRAMNQIWKDHREIDAVILGPEYSLSEIISLREVTNKTGVPLVMYTLRYDQKAKEKAIEAGVDEYHTGELTLAFRRSVELIKRIKNFKSRTGTHSRLYERADGVPVVRLWKLKRLFDILLSSFVLVMLSPVLLLIMALIKWESPGPAFQLSKRVGVGFKPFNLYLFRHFQVSDHPDDVPVVTPFGQFLQNTNLGKLPQFINVLKGDMSLVGTRPIAVSDASQLTKDQIAWRFLVPPGILGLWSIVYDRGENPALDDQVKLDIEYAMKNSIWLDLNILFTSFINIEARRKSLKQLYASLEVDHYFSIPLSEQIHR